MCIRAVENIPVCFLQTLFILLPFVLASKEIKLSEIVSAIKLVSVDFSSKFLI